MSLVLSALRRIIPPHLLLVAVALLSVGAGAGELRNRNTGCIPDWSIAAPIVHKEGLVTVEALSRFAELKVSGSIVKTTLCEENGAFVYRIIMRDAHGRLTNRTVDARAPFGR